MASLELVPKLPVMAVQTGIFLANWLIIKKLFVEPYMQVADRRAALTTGSMDEAKAALDATDRLSERVTQQLVSAAESDRRDRESVRSSAIEERNRIVGAAEAEAKSHIEQMAKTISAQLSEERAKVASTVKSLTDEMYRMVLV